MKKLLIVLGIIALISCEQKSEREKMQDQLAEKKKELSNLRNEITRLTQKLEDLPGEEEGVYKIPVYTKKMKQEEFNHYIQTGGKVEAVQEAVISPEMNGQITDIYVEEGERVRKGQQLYSLNTKVIRSNIEEVKTNLELAQKTYEKQKRLWEEEVGSEMEYLQAKNQKENLEDRLATLREELEKALVKAPFNGVVESINQKEGELATPGMGVMHLVNTKNLKVKTDVSEQYMTNIDEGDTIVVAFPAYSDVKKEIPIKRKGQTIDNESRTFVVESRIDNTDELIKPNQICVVKIRDYTNDSALVVPAEIVKQDMKGDYVYIAEKQQGKTIAKKVYVESGLSHNNQTIILKGLNSGDELITAGYSEVSDGAEITVKDNKEHVE
ncbi:MAG: efflux RND transporter periplasmic adaptor subunit [Bacteroidales bacterium]